MFVARRLVQGLYAGRHPAAAHGPGLEFHDYRSYVPGDDLAAVDWKLYGRTDRYFIRRHRQYTDLNLYLMVDATASMNFAGVQQQRWGGIRAKTLTPALPRVSLGRERGSDRVALPTKFEYAATLAAAIAFLAIRRADRAGVGVFADRLLEHVQPGGTWAHLQRLCHTLEHVEPVAGEGNMAASLAQGRTMLRRRGVLLLISDLLDPPAALFDGLARFRHDRFEVIVFQVLTREELALAGLERASLRMIDAETRMTVSADLARVRGAYREALGAHLTAIRRGCAARDVDYNLLTTNQSIVPALRRYLARRRRNF